MALSERDIQEVAACLSTVRQQIEDIAADAGLSIAQAREAIEILRKRGCQINRLNRIDAQNPQPTRKLLNEICKGWEVE